MGWRRLEERHGFAGTLRTLGGLGAISGPHGLAPSRGAARLRRDAPNAGGLGGPFRGPPYPKGRGVLQTAEELAGLGGEGAALGGGDRLARDELLAERVDEVAVLRDAIVEMRAGGQPGRAHVADHLPLRHAPARAGARAEPREGVVHRLVTRAMLERHRDAAAAPPARGADATLGDSPDRR